MQSIKAIHESHPPKYVFLGVPLTIHLSGEQTGGRFTLIEGTMPADGDGGLHVHTRDDETMYLLDGELEVMIGGQSFTLRPGESYFAPRGVPHRLRNRGRAPAHSLAIHTPAGFDSFVREAGTPLNEWISGIATSDEQLRHVAGLAEAFGIRLLKPPGQE
jgi:mannose-6-phosphate isomerase-like protein (cupin superfamily)